ncbi:MAG: sugar phosphate isomerase/epimerase [Clostridia bacterium]|nr:sugar phosphate isomerase/epimerase [Clostridia bacterium]
MLKTSCSNSHFIDVFGDKGSLVKMKECGFDTVDYGLCAYQDLTLHGYENPKTFMFYKSDAEIKAYFTDIKHIMDDCGLPSEIVHAPYYFFASPDQCVEKEFIEIFLKSIKAAKYLGAKYIVIHPIDNRVDPENFYQETYEYNFRFFNLLKNCALDNGVEIAIENMDNRIALKNVLGPGCFSSAEKILRLVNDLGEGFGACLDTGHSYCCGNDPARFARLLGDKLKVLHLQDTDFNDDMHIPPTCGYINWDDFLTALVDIKFKGVLNMEVNFHRCGDKNMIPFGKFLASLARDFAERIEDIKARRKNENA